MTVPESTVHYLEIVTPDAGSIRDLYAETCGWQFQPMAPELGNAYVAELPGGALLGIRRPMTEDERPTVRTYMRVTDLKAAVETAARLGAEILLEEMEIPGRGMIAIYSHGGVEHGIWQVS